MTNHRTLTGKRLLLGITGGIAAYKSAALVRLLSKAGVEVTVVMTDAAQRFITATTLQALSGSPVHTDAWDRSIPNGMPHIELSRRADAILIAPASADFIAKLCHGFADDLLAATCLARNADRCALLVAPAMNREMWDQAATQRNLKQISLDGVAVLGPACGDQACGETGLGRMLEPAEIVDRLSAHFDAKSQRPLDGIGALVTAGPTFEPIDAVRGISNASSGKMGYAIAEALRDAGAIVTLITGPTALAIPPGIRVLAITTASQMLVAVEDNLPGVKLFFAVAAVADYTPATPCADKLKKSATPLTLTLLPTVDILRRVAARTDAPFCVGFAAESQNIVEHATKKREAKAIPMIVANDARAAIGADDNAVIIIDWSGQHPIPRASKRAVADAIIKHATRLFFEVTRPATT